MAVSMAQRKLVRDKNRTRAIELAVQGVSAQNAARELGVHEKTVRGWFLQARAEWAAQRQDLIETKLSQDLARAEAVIKAILPTATNPTAYLGKGPLSFDKLLASLLDYRARAIGAYDTKQAADTQAALAAVFKRAALEANGEDPSTSPRGYKAYLAKKERLEQERLAAQAEAEQEPDRDPGTRVS